MTLSCFNATCIHILYFRNRFRLKISAHVFVESTNKNSFSENDIYFFFIKSSIIKNCVLFCLNQSVLSSILYTRMSVIWKRTTKNVVKCVLNKLYKTIIDIFKFYTSPTSILKIFKIIDLFVHFIFFKNLYGDGNGKSFGFC